MPSSSAAAAIHNNPMVSSLLAGLKPAADTPLRLRLWNGLQHDFGPDPRVTVALGAPGATPLYTEDLFLVGPPGLIGRLADAGDRGVHVGRQRNIVVPHQLDL